MNECVVQIKEHRRKIAKLEKDFAKRGPQSTVWGFMVDLFYGGNKEPDVERITIGSIADPEGTGQALYDMVLASLKNGLKFWEDAAKRDLAELQETLYKKEA